MKNAILRNHLACALTHQEAFEIRRTDKRRAKVNEIRRCILQKIKLLVDRFCSMQYAVETSRSTSQVTTSWNKRQYLIIIVVKMRPFRSSLNSFCRLPRPYSKFGLSNIEWSFTYLHRGSKLWSAPPIPFIPTLNGHTIIIAFSFHDIVPVHSIPLFVYQLNRCG